MIDWNTFKEQLRANPAKALKSVLLLAGFLLFIWILVVIQTDPISQNRVQVEPSGRLDNFSIRNLNTKDSLAKGIGQYGGAAFPKTAQSDNSLGLLSTMLVFLVVAGIGWLWIRTKKKKQGDEINGNIYTAIARQQLPNGQQLMVAKLNDEYWIMALGGHTGVKLLHRYSGEEWLGIDREPVENNWKNTLLKTLNSTDSKKN